jgi:DNA repair exonuclease SbcCD ATPase subunit
MSKIVPQWLRMRNFLRYGDDDTTFNFEQGLGSIRGANG